MVSMLFIDSYISVDYTYIFIRNRNFILNTEKICDTYVYITIVISNKCNNIVKSRDKHNECVIKLLLYTYTLYTLYFYRHDVDILYVLFITYYNLKKTFCMFVFYWII